ncbi:alpha/beta fold hydrolase [Bacillus sp. Marseille-P3661]|uniref:alpha/beta fold hydrolase n=1 Tax=Bacillus sp. Marseille-P3661 TaxID=1936234 RepID=UPI000C859C0D|nr:alpha/beta hydrolase [Bacillus sp. Marseille-P3661]
MGMDIHITKTINVRGFSIRYSTIGEGKPVVYLHDYRGFEPLNSFLEHLAENYRIVSIELPGFGMSERPEWLTTMEDLSFFFLDILDELDLDRVILVGHSLGGWLAADLTAKFTSRIEKLVLINAMGLHLHEPEIPDVFMMSQEEIKRLIYHNPGLIEEQDPDFLMKSRADTMTARLAWNPRFHDPKLKYRLHRIDVPTLLAWGETNEFIPVEYGNAYKELISHADLVMIPECGHLPQIEQPELLYSKVASFLYDNTK